MREQKVLTCTGYYCSGSSAVTDLLRECENVHCEGDYEVRFLHDPYGVSDLEYHIVQAPNRHNSSHFVNRFLYHMKFLASVGPVKRYEKFFKGRFYQETLEYVDRLVDFKYNSTWHFDVYEKGKLYYLFDRSFHKISGKIARAVTGNKFANVPLPGGKNTAYLVHPTEAEFLAATKEYTNQLMQSLNSEQREFVMCDQLVPSSQIGRYLRYFKNIKVVVVDRDPRDVFIYTTMVENGTIVPKEADQFCKWFRWTRSMTEGDRSNPNILFVRLEDLIFNYEKEKDRIFEFAGIAKEKHTKQKTCFIPEASAKRTRFWLQYPQMKPEIEKIEAELKEYLYEFRD